MSFLKKAKEFIFNLFGFRRNSKYVKNYLHDANIKSSIYMAFIVIVLEIWMIIRSITKKFIPFLYGNDYIKYNESRGTSFTRKEFIEFRFNQWKYSGKLDYIFNYINLFLSFAIISAVVFLFALLYSIHKNKDTKASFITNIVAGSIGFVLIFFLCFINLKSYKTGKIEFDGQMTIIIYIFMALTGAAVIAHAIYKHLKHKNNNYISLSVIIFYAAICLFFGLKVGYSDFVSSDQKMITCFLTMIIFVACLVIWKPYFSIILLIIIFKIFDYKISSFETRPFLDADRVNYITFLISLTMVTISIYQQRIAEAKKDEKLEHDAKFDHLIEIHNFRYLVEKINENIKFDPNYINDKIYLYINLVNFKNINDQRGFNDGDNFLRSFAKCIQEVFDNDLIARQADDHFAVCTKIDGFKEKISLLDSKLNNLTHGLYVLLKVGGYIPNGIENPRRAIDKARIACGFIKRKYGVMYLEYDKEIDEQFNKKQYIVNHLDEAIEKNWIIPYYQPVVWSNNKKLCGAEALARWIDPYYGFLSPADFIPTLEDSRLIHKLDKHIIDYVCKSMREALDEGREIVPVSINFSRLDFEFMDVKAVLNEIVEKYDIDKKFIHVEITESALADNVEFLNSTIQDLKESGYAIWLDDFGSGYSSLNVLKDFNFDVIKIDMKFLSNFDKNEKSKEILDCIIQLAQRLGMKTLTEGVETQEEAQFLDEIGCGRLQGYLFGKPLERTEFEDRIAEGNLNIDEERI